ncbi:hypothetical protein BDQ17DRAFT_1325982 [Cyathus striatus]|nr:hypothetical protein BDQ17DRAFT_1325982 [Cyathus striatus]
MPLDFPLPPYPSKLVDYLTLTESQFYDRAGRAMNISGVNNIKRAILSLEEDPMSARDLFQQIEHMDAEDESFNDILLSPPKTYTFPLVSSSVLRSTNIIQLQERSYPDMVEMSLTMDIQGVEDEPLTDHPEPPPYSSMTLDYMTLTDAQLYKRAPLENLSQERNSFTQNSETIDNHSRYRRKPANIKLYSRGLLAGEIFSIEQAFDKLERYQLLVKGE